MSTKAISTDHRIAELFDYLAIIADTVRPYDYSIRRPLIEIVGLARTALEELADQLEIQPNHDG